MVVISVRIHGVEIIKKFQLEFVFLGGSMEPPWAPTGVKVPGRLLKC